MNNFSIPSIKKTVTTVYPKYTSLVKDNKRLDAFLTKLEENQNKNDILEFYTDIDNQIEVINSNLMAAFKKQEDDLLKYYKDEMYKSQRHLKDLTEEMNEEKLRKKMNQRKEALEQEREELLRDSLKLSNKCNEFKENLKEVVGYSEEIEDELRFLDEQLIYADQQNTNLKQEVLKYQNEITKIDPDYQLNNDEEIWEVFNKGKHRKELSSISMTQKRSQSMRNYESPYSFKTLKEAAYLPQTIEEFHSAKENLKIQKNYNQKLKESLNHPSFELGLVEKVFIESVEKIKKRSFDRFAKKNNSFLPGIKGKDKSGISDKDFSSSKIVKANESLSTEMSLLSDMDMNDLDKRLIMEEFFNNEEIKKHIYGLLFERKEKVTPTTV